MRYTDIKEDFHDSLRAGVLPTNGSIVGISTQRTADGSKHSSRRLSVDIEFSSKLF